MTRDKLNALLKAAEKLPDRGCLYLHADGKFCGSSEGLHLSVGLRDFHPFVSLANLLREVSVMMEWHPISTAPKDATDVLLCERGNLELGFYRPRTSRWVYKDDHDDSPRIHHPTHWMPLPQPPDQRKEEEAP